ncbi:acyl-CoA N-acyltransferase [Canariomyces notabilis]|uniref:Acyl-CoA N-acyltransferase n=1 Tax=Canariomyces notabilis TaxID=2074819 RepID=A0AAN6TAY5_9PEZI|nr:acyl-CoA N-acyltransferase [Canariomyces arenarius]
MTIKNSDPKPEPPLHFRVATPADAGLIQPLVQSAYRGDESRQGWTTEADLLKGNRINIAGILAKITNPDSAVLLAFTGSSPAATKNNSDANTNNGNDNNNNNNNNNPDGLALVGCCEVARLPGESSAYFGMFAVSPRLQGGGIGRRLLAHAEAYCRAAWGPGTVHKLEMTVIWTRAELIAWYERRGYRRTGETRPFPLAEVDGAALRDDLYFVVLEKDLSIYGTAPI